MAGHGRLKLSVAFALTMALVSASLEVAGSSAASSPQRTTVPPIASPSSDKGPAMPPGGPGFAPLPVPPAPTTPPSPVSQPPKKAVQGYVEGRSTEVIAERAETAKVFTNPDGTRTRRISTQPVHFKDPKGAWADIDNAVVPDESRPAVLRNRANAWTVRFAPLPAGMSVDTARVQPGAVTQGGGAGGAGGGAER